MMITIIDSPISWVLAALILFVLGCIFQKWMAADSKAAGVITDKLQEEDDRKTDIIKHLLSSLLYDCGYGNDCVYLKDEGTYKIKDLLQEFPIGPDTWKKIQDPDQACIITPREGREYSPITCSNQLQPAEEKTTICDSCYAGSMASELMQDNITGFWHCNLCRPDLHNEPPTDKKKESKACQ